MAERKEFNPKSRYWRDMNKEDSKSLGVEIARIVLSTEDATWQRMAPEVEIDPVAFVTRDNLRLVLLTIFAKFA